MIIIYLFSSIGRHSKSLNTDLKVCGYCYGKFELIVNKNSVPSTPKSQGLPTPAKTPKTPKTPNPFALYVKENYNSVQKSGKKRHTEVMKILSEDFRRKNSEQ